MKRVILVFVLILLVGCSEEGTMRSAPTIDRGYDTPVYDSVEVAVNLPGSVNERHLNYIGNLAPFPTKSSQNYLTLNSYGVVDSDEVDLQGFYLLEGEQTQITGVIQQIANSIPEGATDRETVQNILDWSSEELICANIGNDTVCEEIGRYGRTAEDVVVSEYACGCTDYTISFVAIARAKGISTTLLETISEKWVAEMVFDHEWNGEVYGHFYSEVYLEDEQVWAIVDPTLGWFTVWDDQYVLGPIPWDGDHDYFIGEDGIVNGAKYLIFERGLDSWDYGVYSEDDFREIIEERYYL